MIYGLRSKIYGLGFKLYGLRFRIYNINFWISKLTPKCPKLVFEVWGSNYG